MSRTVQVLAIAASLAVSWALSSADAAFFGFTRGPATNTSQVSFDTPAPAPVAFLTSPFWPEANAGPNSFDTPAPAPVAFLTSPFWPEANAGPNSFDTPSPTPVPFITPPIQLEANARQINSGMPSPAPAAFYGLPRGLDANVARISFDTASLAPMAFVRFCMRYPQDCKIHRMGFRPRPVALTEARRAELVKVNRDVNRAIRPQENINGVMAEEWLLSPREGDCNDYAVTKRHELLARGWPSRSLLLAEVVVPSGEHHLVLVVRTREDDVVLDNLNWNVRPISQIHYQWVRAQQAKNPKFWSTISMTRATRVAMNTR